MSGPSPDFRTDRPAIQHRLARALRFVDVFSGRQVDVPLDVRAETLPVVPGMPRLPWRAAAKDGVYRFFVSNHVVDPVGAIRVTVTAPGGEYVNHEPFDINLPATLAGPFPLPSDYLVERPLWPTRKVVIPTGETALLVSVRSAGATNVAGLRVHARRTAPAPPPPAIPDPPYGYTDAEGACVVRLVRPEFKRVFSGGTLLSAVSLQLELRAPPAFAVPIAITSPPMPIPNVRLGETTVLFLDVP